MPQLIACIECNKRIRVADDMLGKRIRCPNCGAEFVAATDEVEAVTAAPAAAAANPLEFDEESAPRSRPAAAESPRDPDTWGPVLTGVNLQLIAQFLYTAGALFLALVLFILIVRDPPKKPGEFFDRFLGNCMTVSFVLIMLSWLLSVAASGCFLCAPSRHGARGWAAACLALAALTIYLEYFQLRNLITTFTGIGGGNPGSTLHHRGGAVSIGMNLMFASLAEAVRLFALPMFLRSVGRNTDDKGLANFGLYASFAAPVAYGLMLALDMLLNLIEEPKGSGSSRRDEEKGLALIMLFLHTLSLLIVLLITLLVLFRARATVQKTARP